MKEATARIKINRLLENAGWRFFADATGPANIQLEPNVKVTEQDLDSLGADFEKASRGFIDFLLLEEEFAKFIADKKPEEPSVIPALKQFFKAYATDSQVREIIENKQFQALYTTSSFTVADLKAVPPKYRKLIPEYIKDYVSLNQFVALK